MTSLIDVGTLATLLWIAYTLVRIRESLEEITSYDMRAEGKP